MISAAFVLRLDKAKTRVSCKCTEEGGCDNAIQTV